MTPEEQELTETIRDMVHKSHAGEMTWTRSNPTTFTWARKWDDREGARITIQKATKRKPSRSPSGVRMQLVEQYIFQVLDLSTGGAMVSISSDENPNFHESLAGLYNAASTNITKKGLGFLKRAIRD